MTSFEDRARAEAVPEAELMKTFELHRETDVSGISGTGVVAEGIKFSDGRVAIRWIVGDHQSTVVWDSIADVEAIHGHGGATRIVWAREQEPTEAQVEAAALALHEISCADDECNGGDMGSYEYDAREALLAAKEAE